MSDSSAADVAVPLPSRDRSAVDALLTRALTVNWELVGWCAIIALTLVTRLYNVGHRSMSHDESLHTQYSWNLFMGKGYRHDPMMHGPLLFHATALSYFLFGVSDATARLFPVLCGLLLVLTPLLLKKWLGPKGALAAGTMMMLSPTIMYYSRYIRHDIPVELFSVLMMVSLFRYLDDKKPGWIVLALVAASLNITTAEMAYINGFLFVVFLLVAFAVETLPKGVGATIGLAGVAVGLGLFAFVAFSASGAVPAEATNKQLLETMQLVAGLALIYGLIAMLLASKKPGEPELRNALLQIDWMAAAAGLVLALIVYLLFFTTFFTNMDGVGGFINSIKYWVEQHDVVRGGQPWYYYLLFVPMYEFLPLFLAMAATLFYVLRPGTRLGRGNDRTTNDPSPAAWLFVPFLVAWAAGSFFMFSWAGEKMPWLILHPTVPLSFLAGRFLADLVSATDWPLFWRRGWIFSGLSLLALIVGLTLAFTNPFQGQTAAELGATSTWIIGLVLVVALVAMATRMAMGLSGRQARLGLALTFALLLAVLNTHYSFQANFVNDELATEYIVYAHGTPDDREVVSILHDMQNRLGVAQPLRLGYDNEVSWPFTWYFRDTDFPGAVYMDQKPSGAAQIKDLDVILVGDPNYGKFDPYLRKDFVATEFRRMWWPNEGYKEYTLEKLWASLTDPKLRQNWMNILLFRRYTADPESDDPKPKSLTDWYHHANMRMYVRRELVAQLWPLAQARPDWLASQSAAAGAESPAAAGPEGLTLAVDKAFEADDKGQPLSSPKDVAVAPNGDVVVIDQGNKRVAVFGPDGVFKQALASGELEYTADEKTGAKETSAWGVGVGPDGAIYVADTWNHKIRKFITGTQVAAWGVFGQPKSIDTDLTLFYGPRDVAVGPSGNVFVTDTGNKRVVEFSPEGEPIRAFGGGGLDPGQFDEPTSLAFDPNSGDLYVADMWNYRIQRFDKDLNPVVQWTVDGWDTKDANDKAYLAVTKDGWVVASDPSKQRVWIFDKNGTALATLDLPMDERGLDKPIGVAADAEGRILVASNNSSVVTRYAALPDLTKLGQPAAGLGATGGLTNTNGITETGGLGATNNLTDTGDAAPVEAVEPALPDQGDAGAGAVKPGEGAVPTQPGAPSQP